MEKIWFIDLTADLQNPEASVYHIVEKVRPEWEKDDTEVKVNTWNIINKRVGNILDKGLMDMLYKMSLQAYHSKLNNNFGISSQETKSRLSFTAFSAF